MGEHLLAAISQYEAKFNDDFPTLCFTCYTEDEVVKIIEDCIAKDADVYDAGYLQLDGTLY